MSRILIADDHAVVRAGYRQYLAMDNLATQFGEAGNAAETLQKVRASSWDLLLLDISLPDRPGIAVLEEVRSEFPQLPVLVISGLPEDQYAIEALRSGASGYLSKESAPNELVAAVHRVLGGQRYISAVVAERMVSDLGRSGLPAHEQLSGREREVFQRLAQGATITAIADELSLSIKTVSTYRTRLLEKMRLKSNADLTSYAIRHGIQ